MTDATIIGKNSPLVAYIKLTFNGFSTGEIPPKYISSFNASRIRDKTGTYSIDLLYGPNTFKRGDDYLGIRLAKLLNDLNTTPSSDFSIPCTLEYGWQGTNTKIKFNQATITTFSEDVQEGGFISYNIGGVLNKASSRAMQLNITSEELYDLNNDGSVTVDDISVAVHDRKDQNLANDIFTTIYPNSSTIKVLNMQETKLSLLTSDIIPAGGRLSDKIEQLANYIFEGIYNVVVDHSDPVMDKDTKINNILKQDSSGGVTSNDTLYQRLLRMVHSCYSCKGYNVSYRTVGNTIITKQYSLSEYVESNQGVSEIDKYLTPNTYEFGMQTVRENIESGNLSAKDSAFARRTISQNMISAVVEKEPITGEQFKIFYVDNANKYGKQTIRISPKSAVYDCAELAHYEISNLNRNNNVLSFTQDTNLIPITTAFQYAFSNKPADIDVDKGQFTFSKLLSLSASMTQEQLDEYAEEFAMNLIDHLDNTVKASLSVVFDKNCALLGIDDIVTITNTINAGSTIFNGGYYITSVNDSLSGGMLKTDYSLIYTKSNVHSRIKEYVLRLINESRSSKTN